VKIDLPYQPREQFIDYHNRKARWSVLVCHRRSGKTVSAVNDLIIGSLECPHPRPQLAYVAPNYSQAKRIAWEYLKHYSEPLIEQIHESELRVTLKTKAKIYLLGAEKAQSLRGMYLDGVILDEYAQIKPSVLSQVILPCLSDRQGWATIMGTPMGKNHFYDIYKRASNDPLWYSKILKASDSGIISEDELATIKSNMDLSDYQQEYECSFDAALRGAIYGVEIEKAEQERRIGEFALDPHLPLDVICDIGFADDTVLIFFQQHRDGILVHEVYSNNELEWDHYLDQMDTRSIRDVYLPHDARAKNLQTGRSIVEMTIRRGYRPRVVPDHKLRDGIAAARKLLPYVYWNQSLCSHAIEAMKSYRRQWDDKKSCYSENPVHDWTSHVADAFRYLAVTFPNLPKPAKKVSLPSKQVGLDYAFNLEDLFNDPRTNPALRREF